MPISAENEESAAQQVGAGFGDADGVEVAAAGDGAAAQAKVGTTLERGGARAEVVVRDDTAGGASSRPRLTVKNRSMLLGVAAEDSGR
jgi:hypothetical protein